jgi:hypothetical protein
MEWFWIILIGLGVYSLMGNSQEKKEAQEKKAELLQRQKEAEDYIMKSGDEEAIKMLMLARANPSNYSQVLEGGMNKGNDTLKMALGVMTGVVAGNMISSAITYNAISQALSDMETELANDLSNIDLASSEVMEADGGDFDFFG